MPHGSSQISEMERPQDCYGGLALGGIFDENLDAGTGAMSGGRLLGRQLDAS